VKHRILSSLLTLSLTASAFGVSAAAMNGNSGGVVPSTSVPARNPALMMLMKHFDITMIAGEGGSIVGENSVRMNGDAAYQIMPAEGYRIADVLVDGESVGAQSEILFDRVREAHTIEASFAKNPTIAELVSDAYIYAFPLVLMDVTADKVTNTVERTWTQAPANQFVHIPVLADASAKDIVLPNVDTIYSQAFLDLSETAVIVELPKTDRFCIMQFMDAWSNTIGMVECMDFAEERMTYIVTGPNFDGEIPEGMIEIESPTAMVWILGRTICADNVVDAPIVRAIQKQMAMYTLEQYENGTTDVPLGGEFNEAENVVPLEYTVSLSLEEFFDRANELMLLNPPAEEDLAYIAKFAPLGIGPGLDFDSALFAGQADMLRLLILRDLVANCLAGSTEYNVVNGHWSYYGAPIGDYGTEYDFRTLIALAGFGANPPDMAIYPMTETDNEGNLLVGTEGYVLHIPATCFPEMYEHGFWSITAYGTDQYLIANELNRYTINSLGGAKYNEDGSLDIYVSAEKPDDSIVSNWLPVGESGFKLYFRVYLPKESVTDGTWIMPDVIKTVG